MNTGSRGENNPRSPFAETVSIAAWRTDFDGESGVADLFIDAVFDEGRYGGQTESVVRFRMSLKQAEIHVIQDSTGLLSFPAASISRKPLAEGKRTTTSEQSRSAKGKAKATLSKTGLEASVDGEAEAGTTETRKEELVETVGAMSASHRKTAEGWAFIIRPSHGKKLRGAPWDADARRLTIKDAGFRRKRGEPPEPRVELRCRREDLEITDIQFTDDTTPIFKKLPRQRKIAVEQYIKEVLAEFGIVVGDISDPFAQLVLADVSPELAVVISDGD